MNYPFLCPKCKKELTLQGRSYFCENGHCYDVAKSGYVNLVLVNNKHSADPGDNKEMIKARVQVMDAGYYDSLAATVVDAIGIRPHAAVLDCGCGVGSIVARVKEAFPDALALGCDISKNAAEAAATAETQINERSFIFYFSPAYLLTTLKKRFSPGLATVSVTLPA